MASLNTDLLEDDYMKCRQISAVASQYIKSIEDKNIIVQLDYLSLLKHLVENRFQKEKMNG